jgi:ATPase subunit of ABC transporter with duplicated ATPase domains
MSALITLDTVSAAIPEGRLLFENLTLSIGRERTGLIGRNGAGKSTLLSIMSGALPPRTGDVSRTGRIAVLSQNPVSGPQARLADLLGVHAELERLERIEAGRGDEADFAEADWTLPARIEAALAEVGLEPMDPMGPASTLSGGQATRAALAGLFLQAPDVLLLDEPTNHLDAKGRQLIADAIRRWRGGAVVVSHDRDLLESMDRIVELSSLGARIYGGGYGLYQARKAEEAAAAERDLSSARKAATVVERESQMAAERKARSDSAGRRFAARGSEPKILLGAQAERAENTGARGVKLAERKREAAEQHLAEARERVELTQTLAFDLPPSGLAAGRVVVSFEEVGFGWPDAPPLFEGLTFRIAGPERVAITGPNGSGKSSLIDLIVGSVSPTRGAVSRGVPMVMLDQHAGVLKDDETLREAYVRLNPGASRRQAQAALARFLFRNIAAEQRVGTLSGGERLRGALACVLAGLQPPQFLILDEPTNHLDLASVEAIEAALRAYDGALLVVSHDERFLDAVGVNRRLPLGGAAIQAF